MILRFISSDGRHFYRDFIANCTIEIHIKTLGKKRESSLILRFSRKVPRVDKLKNENGNNWFFGLLCKPAGYG